LSKEPLVKKFLFVLWRMSKADLRLLWFALKHGDRPRWLLPAAIGLALYALSPFNFALPFLGVIDDMVLVPLALHYLLKLLPPNILHGFGRQGAVRAW
jgi:uncharacterized membrane protein YkvA (DUF1232 family)